MNLETFWAEILSEDPQKITAAIRSVSEEEQRAVIKHLERMTCDSGWMEEQRRRAKKALSALGIEP